MGVVALIVVHGLDPSGFRVDSTTLALVVVVVVSLLVPLLESATLPGGGGSCSEGSSTHLKPR